MAYRNFKRRYEPKIAKRIANHQQATKLQDVKTVTRCVHRCKFQRALFQRCSCGCSHTHVTHCAHFSTFTVQGRIEKSFHQVVRHLLAVSLSATVTTSTSTNRHFLHSYLRDNSRLLSGSMTSHPTNTHNAKTKLLARDGTQGRVKETARDGTR